MLLLFSVCKVSRVFFPAYLNNSSLIWKHCSRAGGTDATASKHTCQTNLFHDRMSFQWGCWFSWHISKSKKKKKGKQKKKIDLSISLTYNAIGIIIYYHPSICPSIHVLALFPYVVAGGRDPIPAAFRQDVEYTPYKSPAQRWPTFKGGQPFNPLLNIQKYTLYTLHVLDWWLNIKYMTAC